jgi:hypothetical protein
MLLLRSLLSPFRRTPLPGWITLRVWLVLGLMAPGLGLGGWARPAAADHAQVAEQGVHAGPLGHADPAELPHELPLRSEAEDAEDAKDAKESKDDLRKRSHTAALWLLPVLDLHLIASLAACRFADGHDGDPGCTHRGRLHNRGPPLA